MPAQRVIGLDVLRFVAVLLVLGVHLDLTDFPGHPLLDTWQRIGFVGVDIFFVLSGFLVSGLLFGEYERSGRMDVGRFLLRRAFKIYPAFWMLIAVTVLVRLVMMPPAKGFPLATPLSAELMFIQNYIPGLWGHTWTLAIEEHFYLVISVLLGWFASHRPGRNPFRALPTITVSLMICCLILRLGTEFAYRNEEYFYLRHCGTHLRIDSLFFGALLAYCWHFGDLESRLRRVPGAALVLAGVVVLGIPFGLRHAIPGWASRAIEVMFFFFGGGALVLAALKLTSATHPLIRLAAVFGQASYSIYLWHFAVAVWGGHLITRFFGQKSLGTYLVGYIVGAYLFGWLMTWLVEGPALRLREKLFPSRRPPPPNAPAHAGSIP